jgi:WD repeat-containing protein 23
MTLFRGTGLGRHAAEPKDPNRFPKVPSSEGRKLMDSGVFGTSDYDLRPKKQIARRILDREIGLGDRIQRKRNNGVLAQVWPAPLPISLSEWRLLPLILIFYTFCQY